MIEHLSAKNEGKQQPIKPIRLKEITTISCKINQYPIPLYWPNTLPTITKQLGTLQVRLAFNDQPFHTQQTRRMRVHQTHIDQP
jgi:hypothetical protein